MKIKNKIKFLSLIALSSIPILVLPLTSCSSNATINKMNTIYLNYDKLGSIILSKTLAEWQDEFQNNNFDDFIIGLNQINDNFKNINFEINSNTNATIDVYETISSSPIFINAIAKFQNESNILIITLNNLFIYPPQNLVHPNLELVQNPISIEQESLPVISNIDPTLVLPNQWLSYLNSVAPSGTTYIPNTLYYLKSKQFISSSVYQIIYTINDQYLPMLDINNFPNIIFNINVSPNINKTLKEEFVLNVSDVKEYFSGLTAIDVMNMSEVDVYNILFNYVKNLGNVKLLQNCVNPNTNLVYNYLIINEPITNSIIIKFSSNPDLSDSTIYFYTFRLNF